MFFPSLVLYGYIPAFGRFFCGICERKSADFEKTSRHVGKITSEKVFTMSALRRNTPFALCRRLVLC